MNYEYIEDITFNGIDHNDYPDYSNAYIDSAFYNNKEMTQEQLEEINEDREFVLKQLMDHLF